MRIGRGVAVAVMLAAALAASPCAAENDRAEGEADFLDICPVALLAPTELPTALGTRGLAEAESARPAATWDTTVYATAGGKRTVTLTRQHFSDFSMASCVVSIPVAMSKADLEALRSRLEKQRLIGKLEGEVVQATPTFQMALLKRPGNTPIVTVNVMATATSTTLMISRWDLRAGI